jgi:predicted small secreted protein
MKKLLPTAVLTAAVLLSACGSKTGSGAAAPIAGGSSTSSSATTATTTAPSPSSSAPVTTAAATVTTAGGSSSSAAPGSTVATVSTAAEAPLVGFTPRGFDIRYLHFDVKKAFVSSLDPYKYDDKVQTNDPAKKWLYVFGSVTNKLNFTEDYIKPSELALSVGTKVLPVATSVGGVGQNVTRGATSKDGGFAFEVTDEKLVEPVIIVNEPGNQQEKYALTGAATEAPFPKPVVMPPTGTIPLENGGVINLTFGKATVQNYVGFDEDGSSIKSGVALKDQRWLYITFEASYTKPPDGSSSASLYSDMVHLIIDGKRQSQSAVYDATSKNIPSGTTVKGHTIVDVPITGSLEIEWGKVGNPTTKFAVTLPA